jgi:murein DD-endopeptidase MepM/ murein hydrolase activator NlpD
MNLRGAAPKPHRGPARRMRTTAATLGLAVLAAVAVVALGPGAGPAAAAGPRPAFQLPFPCGQVVEMHSYGHAPALDIFRVPRDATEGNPVIAPAAGRVNQSYYAPEGAGNIVQIDHGGGWFTTYIHLQSRAVQVGDQVAAGSPVGLVGHTGVTSNNVSHLHFEMAIDVDGNGEADWGHPNPERVPPVFDGVTYGQANDQTYQVASHNCGQGARRPLTTDVTGDGKGDLAVLAPGAAAGTRDLYVFLGGNGFGFWAAPKVPFNQSAFHAGSRLLVSDIDGDGAADLLLARPATATTTQLYAIRGGPSPAGTGTLLRTFNQPLSTLDLA